jgi:hypothetical protein
MPLPHDSLNLPRSLGGGLVLRLAAPADVEAIADLGERVLLAEDDTPGQMRTWIEDLMSGRHPTVSAADFVVVEDTPAGRIVSSACLIPQVWSYADIPFGVGRPELVGTDPAYRRRGLVRAIFGALHDLSAAYGHLAQGITGVPWFYRQFGYEYALPLGGARNLSVHDVPALKEGEAESFHIRPAVQADLPALARLYRRQCQGKLVTIVHDQARWRYNLLGHSAGSDQEVRLNCVCDGEGRVVGYYGTPGRLWGIALGMWELAVQEGVSLRAALPPVLRALKAQGEAMAAAAQPQAKTLTALRFALGPEHPAYDAFHAWLRPLLRPYGWYVRVPDLATLLRHITPALERRLSASLMSGFSGVLNLNFYRSGLRLVFEAGRLIEVGAWRPPETNEQWEGAAFPPLVFLQLLFCFRSLEELRYAFPDCWGKEEPGLLLNALFPKQPSWVVPLG